MKLMMYTVLDKAVGAYLPPFYCRSTMEAIRSFGEACNNREHVFHKHAADYTLMFCGEFDDACGFVRGVEPERVISAIEALMDDPFKDDSRVVEERLALSRANGKLAM